VLAQIAVGREEQHRAVERPTVALHHTEHQVQPSLGGDPGEPIDDRSGDIDRSLEVANGSALGPSRVRSPTTVPKVIPRGYAGRNASGNTASDAPPALASAARRPTFSNPRSRSKPTAAACTTAAVKDVMASHDHPRGPPPSRRPRVAHGQRSGCRGDQSNAPAIHHERVSPVGSCKQPTGDAARWSDSSPRGEAVTGWSSPLQGSRSSLPPALSTALRRDGGGRGSPASRWRRVHRLRRAQAGNPRQAGNRIPMKFTRRRVRKPIVKRVL
jgi:hypothetical protein